MTARAVPAIEGWFTTGETGEAPALLGTRCQRCGTVAFPPIDRRSGDEVAAALGGRVGSDGGFCPNPTCEGDGDDLVSAELSRQGRVWSYTDARYQPPPPYIPRTDPYEPFALAAVELEAEGMIVLGQVADGYGCDDLAIGDPVELVVEPLYQEDDTTYLVWKWRPVAASRGSADVGRTTGGARATEATPGDAGGAAPATGGTGGTGGTGAEATEGMGRDDER